MRFLYYFVGGVSGIIIGHGVTFGQSLGVGLCAGTFLALVSIIEQDWK